jgi:eukaryotic-like serine/threonine-protein kinase
MPWQVPGYRPREDLAGGTGRVVLATDETTGDLVVIKYVNADSSHTSDDLRAAIEDIGTLPDDYFVRIRELVQDSGHNAIVMDPVNGTTMRALIRDGGAFEPESALIVFRDILTGLTYAQALDIVHGDVSPENVMINADGRPVMLNVGAATWDPREPGLSSGVYLAPERWSGGPPTTPADVYAATVGFVESVTGEPPYWEDTDLERLRRRHESEDIDVSGVPAALHDVVRAGMAKRADSRTPAAALLDLVETAAIAGYGRDWPDRGRDGVIQRVRSGSLPLDGTSVTDAGGDGRDSEDAANDDYYTDVSPADGDGEAESAESAESLSGPSSRDATPADAVMAAAADIVAFAQLRDAAEADAILAASADEDLTDEEETAVAEIERFLFLDEPSAAADQASSSEATAGEPADASADDAADAAAGADHEADAPAGAGMEADAPAGADHEADAPAGAGALAAADPDRVPTQPPPGVERAPAASDADRAPSEAGSEGIPASSVSAESLATADSLATTDSPATGEVIAGTAAAEHVAAGSASAGNSAAAQRSPSTSGAGANMSGSAAEPDAVPLSAGSTTRTSSRPRWLVTGAVAAALVVAGLLAWAGVGLTGSGTRPAAASSRPVGTVTSPTPAPSLSVPASAGVPPIGGTPTGTQVPPSASPSATAASTGASATSSTAPTLPLTGFEHPIRLMAAIAVAFIVAGALLLYAGRRREEAPAGRQRRARTPASG